MQELPCDFDVYRVIRKVGMHTVRYIITGGPGSGKSTLLDALGKRGYRCFEEVSRRLIKEQARLPNGIMPWNDLPAFAELAVDAMVEQYHISCEAGGVCFFDRAIPDVFGYLKNSDIAVPVKYRKLLMGCCFQQDVFILPPWSDIFEQDSERPQTYGESVSLYRALCDAYLECGFRLHHVPKGSVEERVECIVSLVAGRQEVIK